MDLDRVEAERKRLEDNIGKLEQSLRHWQLWEAEYEGLREEIDDLPADASHSHLLALSKSYSGDLVNEKEIVDILGLPKALRSPTQISGLLSRRIDYTQQNVRSVSKQLNVAQKALDRSSEDHENGSANHGVSDMTEIIEQLDDDGNVISSKLSRPGESTDEVLSSLAKVGLSERDFSGTAVDDQAISQDTTQDVGGVASRGSAKQEQVKAISDAKSTRPTTTRRQSTEKKSVSFSEDVKSGADKVHAGTVQPSLADLTKGSFSEQERVWQLDDNEKAVDFTSPHIPQDESPEDAALRRQMLQYNLDEVGAVVAQLDLEEIGSSENEDDDDDGYVYDDSEMTDHESDEDEHGMSTSSAISDEYREKMRQLEEKLNAQVMQNIGPGPLPDEQQAEEQQTQTAGNDDRKPQREQDGRKSVRFVEDADIATTEAAVPRTASRPAMNDTISERSSASTPLPAISTAPQKFSRFKAARASSEKTQVPSKAVQKEGTPLAETLVERPIGANASAAAPDPDEVHPEQLRRELAQDYYRQRNNLIKRQGGFTQENDDDGAEDSSDVDATEASAEPPKRVSRFMAARVKPDKVW